MVKRVLRASCGIALAAAAACSSTSSSKSTVTVSQACADFASSGCKKLQTCAPFLVQLVYGDEATCTARVSLECPGALMASGTTVMSAGFEACVQARDAMSCTDFLSNQTAPACRLSGSLPVGAPCAAGEQCSSAYCNILVSGACGVCATRSPVGGACLTDSDCELSGLACSFGSCVPLGAVGAACDIANPCEGVLFCSAAGTCTPRLTAGTACDPAGDPSCDSTIGLYCDPTTNVCTQAQIASAGGACGAPAAGALTVCAGRGFCQLDDGSLVGTCEAAALEGAACDAVNGPNCLPPASCLFGVCTSIDPASCQLDQ